MPREIRQLRSGERVPEAPPRRYINKSHGYVRLRWRVGPARYVEAYEHRVSGGVVVDAEHVHHRNHKKDDNSPGNLAPLTAAEHARKHLIIDRAAVVRLYESGMSTQKVAERVGTNRGNVSRMLREEGIAPRRKADYSPSVSEEDLRAARSGFGSAPQIARHFGVPLSTIYRLMREYGIAAYPIGRPTAERGGHG